MKTNVHFIGIGGVGMSSLAKLTKHLGFSVSGSDISESAITDSLKNLYIPVYKNHKIENISSDTSLIVYSAAIPEDNPEIIFARKNHIKTMERSEYLGYVMSLFKFSAAVSGTHGKSTTSAMVSKIFSDANLSPTCLIGGDTEGSDLGYIEGSNNIFIAEACEYKNGFLNLNPFAGIILNTEYEHTDFFPDINSEISSFKKFAAQINPKGFLIINKESESEYLISSEAKCKIFTFSALPEKNSHHISISNLTEEKGFFSFDLLFGNLNIGRICLSVPGFHNVYNALAAGGLAHLFGIQNEIICKALSEFKGVKRRLEYKGKFNGAFLFDDYAHHPTEISASLSALKKISNNRIICLFQPHTYSRTISLFDDFVKALSLADEILIAPIYAAREKYTDVIKSENLTESLIAFGKESLNFSNFSEITEYLKNRLTENDTLVAMGAGDINNVLESLK